MPKTRINCPNCRQPVTADIEQLFDLNADPAAKQRFLSGSFNLIQCPNCGYQGSMATPIVYHDPDKELLLTFVPAEIGLPRDDQERVIGSLINQVINKLPQEKRKGYLLRPQSTLTLQGLVERVLEAEGITREMIQAQQQRLNLIQRLMNTAQDARTEIAKQEDKLIDSEFFGLLRRLIDASMMGGDQGSAQQLSELQDSLLPVTTFGKELQAQSKEIEDAVADLRAAGKGLNREKMLDLVISAKNDTRLRALVSLARPIMDYSFFQLLSERIDQAPSDGRAHLAELRDKLLAMTREVDQQVEARSKEARGLLESILQAEDVGDAMLQNLQAVDEFFLEELNRAMDAARKKGDLGQIGKLQKMVDTLQQLSAAPPEVALIEELLEAEDDHARRQIMQAHQNEITPEFLSALANITTQVQSSDDKELAERVAALNRQALRFSMEQNLK
ncbi:MAG TPA: CpXC domain-containing protein [Anaerolineales bacterium]